METVARALYEVFALFGPPKIMQSDNGSEFVNKVLEKLVAAAGINHRLVAPYNPRANGVAERFVRTIKEALRKQLAGAFHHWDQALPGVTLLGDQHQSVGNQQNGTVHLVLWQSGEPVGGLHGAGARAAPWAGRRGGPEQAPPRDGIESATGVAPGSSGSPA